MSNIVTISAGGEKKSFIRVGGVLRALSEVSAKGLAAMPQDQQQAVSAALGKAKSAMVSTPKANTPAKPAAAPQRAQTEEQARAEMRHAIASSQGNPVELAKAVAPAIAPKPAISSAATWARAHAVEAQRMGLDRPAAAANTGWTAEQAALAAQIIL